MPGKNLSLAMIVVLAIFAVTLLAVGTPAVAQEEMVLHSFSAGAIGGYDPNHGLTFDSAGNLYGTTFYGGTGDCTSSFGNGCGTVFELSPKTGGGWTETVLHSFSNNGKDGTLPTGVLYAAGNLYGTTLFGGTGVCSRVAPTGCGTVFELAPKTGGGWTETVLYSFGGVPDASDPEGGVIRDDAGNLFGTTVYGGTYNEGTVFELSRKANGAWTEKILNSFSDGGTGGFYPGSSLVRDPAGNVYGGTYDGGAYTDGVAFELTPQGESWTEKVLYNFDWGKSISGGGPSGLLRDAAGNLYGTTSLGGTSSSGAVFELSDVAGNWTETTLYSFDIYTTGDAPNSSLVLDAAGNLYGTAAFGGAGTIVCLWFDGGTESASCGTVFELTPAGDGSWTQTTLHSFGTGADGQVPAAGLIRDATGKLYGTTTLGGANGGGTVFEIKP